MAVMSSPPGSMGTAGVSSRKAVGGTLESPVAATGASSSTPSAAVSPMRTMMTVGTTTTSIPAPAEVESTIQRLSEHRNVRGVIILNRDAVVIRSSGPIFQGSDGHFVLRRYVSQIRKIVDAVAGSVGHIELDDQLRFLRIRTQLHELLITPGPPLPFLLAPFNTDFSLHPNIQQIRNSPWLSFKIRQSNGVANMMPRWRSRLQAEQFPSVPRS
ncbi:hypothetical protein VP01_217g2 [Puccinia sorghi]|uniref:Roadblock/LAMTOR2 domain-containing protein n=1 Tax=Puccinia sorghi TaxID=27349 RepID=A0A0L6V9A8_9BASI|nr:hypothetical protein VP01_217g2 [Puccinia sorghi]